MHILLVDDEALARQRLRTLLADCQAQQPGLRLHVQEAAHAAQALALLQAPGGQAIDLLLLDIHMPGQDGLALAQCLQRLPQAPALVFVTAHAEHAVSAFELDAVDYLTKPVRLPRLQQALAKVQRLRGLGHTLGAGAAQPAAHPTVPTEAPAHEAEALCIQERGRTERVPLTELLYIKAEQKYLTVRTLSAPTSSTAPSTTCKRATAASCCASTATPWWPAMPCARWKNTTTSSQAAPRPTPGPCACTAAPSC